LGAKKGHKVSEATRRKISLANKGNKPSELAIRKSSEKGKSLIGKKNPFYGKHHTEETKKFLSERVISKETKKRMSQAKKGKKLSKEHSRKIALGNTGKKRTPEVKKKMSEGKMGEKNPFYGKKHTPESKKKISEHTTGEKNPFYGKQHTEESKIKQSEKMQGRYQGEDNPFFGKHHTEEVRKILIEIRSRTIFPKTGTTPMKLLEKILEVARIKFQNEKLFDFGSFTHRVDYFVEPNICIEVNGDRWHANPKPHRLPKGSRIHPGYKADDVIAAGKKLTKTAKYLWEKDARYTKALESRGNVVIPLWASDIEYSPEECLQKIIEAIKEARK